MGLCSVGAARAVAARAEMMRVKNCILVEVRGGVEKRSGQVVAGDVKVMWELSDGCLG